MIEMMPLQSARLVWRGRSPTQAPVVHGAGTPHAGTHAFSRYKLQPHHQHQHQHHQQQRYHQRPQHQPRQRQRAAMITSAAGAVAGAVAEPLALAAASLVSTSVASASAAQLVAAAAAPVAKLALYCAVGAWASHKGLLTTEGRRIISTLTLHIFTPCLMFSKLAVGVGLAEVAQLWVVSANMIGSHIVGLLLGLVAARLAAVPDRLRPHLVLSCTVGNVGNAPFILCASLAGDPALPFAVALGAGAATDLALRYVALSNFTASLIQFPLAHIFLSKPPPPPTDTAGTSRMTAIGDASSNPGSSSGSSSSSGGSSSGTRASSSANAGQSASVPLLSLSALNTSSPSPSSPPSPTTSTSLPSSTSASTTASTSASTSAFPTSSTAASLPSTVRPPLWRTVVAGVLSPPTVASILAVLVASVGWMKGALYSPSGSLRLVGEVVESLGGVCIPALLLVLGANLARGPGVAAGRLPTACVTAAVVTRLVLLPLVCGAMLWGAWTAGLLPRTDPLAMLVMLIMHATPTAVMVHSMASIFRNAEDEVAVLLFWQYAASLVTLPLVVAGVLQLLGPAAASPGAWGAAAAAAAASASSA